MKLSVGRSIWLIYTLALTFNIVCQELLRNWGCLANGIVAFNSTGNISNMSFSDMNSVAPTAIYPFEGFGIRIASKSNSHWFNINEPQRTMSFDNCKTGIKAIGYAGKVENSVMTNVGVGIDWSYSQARDIRMLDNTISARQFGIRSGLNEPQRPISAIKNNTITITGQGAGTNPVSGIQMDELGLGYAQPQQQIQPGSGWDVLENTITMSLGGRGISYRNGFFGLLEENNINDLGSGTSPGRYDGIFVEGSSFSQIDYNDVTRSTSAGGNATSHAIYSQAGFASGYTCNCVDNTSVGVQFNDMADFTDNVRGNKLNNHDDTGLQLGDPNFQNPYIGTQYHAGNEWDLNAIPSAGFGGVFYGSIDMSKLSQFFVDPNEKNGALNPDVDPSEWFKPEVTSPPSFDCANDCEAPTERPQFEGETDVPTFLDESIVTDKLFPEVFEDETNWKGAYRLYRKMLRRPNMATYGSEYSDFKADHDSLSTGRLARIAEEKSQIFTLTQAQDSILESYRLAWHVEMAGLGALDSLLQAGDTTTSQLQYDTAVLESTAALTEYEQYLTGLAQARRAKIQTLLALNTVVTTSLTPDANHKTVNGIVLNLLLTDTLASGDLSTLETIAEQCPLEGGDAVYEARAIVAYYSEHEFDDYELCTVSQRPTANDDNSVTPTTKKLTVYPNPTTGNIFLSTTKEVKVRVYNQLGQLLLEQTVSDSRLSLAHLQPGLYQLQVFQNGQSLATHSILLLNH